MLYNMYILYTIMLYILCVSGITGCMQHMMCYIPLSGYSLDMISPCYEQVPASPWMRLASSRA